MLPHLGFDVRDGAAYAVITGDPGRVPAAAAMLERPVRIAASREYTTYAGTLNGTRVLVTSHGIGGPSAAICVEELARAGVRTIIRVGTCGGMQLRVRSGDLVVASAAVRQEGTGLHYLPIEYPAVADFGVTSALADQAARITRTHVGVVQCKDSYYGQHEPRTSPVGETLEAKWRAWMRADCLASEMESAALFIVAAVRGIRAGCVLKVVWNQERRAAGLPDDTDTDTTPAFEAALAALTVDMKEMENVNMHKESCVNI